MADYIPCRRGERPFAPTIWYTMQQITAYILKTPSLMVLTGSIQCCNGLQLSTRNRTIEVNGNNCSENCNKHANNA